MAGPDVAGLAGVGPTHWPPISTGTPLLRNPWPINFRGQESRPGSRLAD
ncbi:hypothetical protein I547_6970 [Mycobacterium kansasii 824]|uniref:Uncharacterized protein n=1 Tax=Mycobacterium kansasii TaxID=1768 RepID=A0A1V3X0B0_MYCKA|nr:hypothetical protein I547_6970 [Mycobacterium kansasii 824]KEP40868.1 hypothetical protein MKSMC1_39940 [Mycobacterium kansasii]OOK72793.1 hypothetical protein BZL29_4866 [Mycobacterium kansasii]OOK76599.1 hypothetical protein BZL30_3166 [Mycobacterium kansasii]